MGEAMKEIVPVYNVKLDVGSSTALADAFAWFNKPGLPPEEKSMLIDDVLYQLKYKMNRMPDEALRLVLQFLLELQEKIAEIIYDITHRETKINPDTMRELRDK